jgi:hypothetical protein
MLKLSRNTCPGAKNPAQSHAGQAVEAYHARAAIWPGSKFRRPNNAVVETDPALPGVRFIRFADGSMARVEPNGDAVEC